MKSKYNLFCDIHKVYERIKEKIVIPARCIDTSIDFELTYSREDTFIRLKCDSISRNILKYNQLKAKCDFYDCEVVLYTNIVEGVKKNPFSITEISLFTESLEPFSTSNIKLDSTKHQCFELNSSKTKVHFEFELKLNSKINTKIKGCVTKRQNNIPWVEFSEESAKFLENEKLKYYEMIYRKKESLSIDFDENFSIAYRTKAPIENNRDLNNNYRVILVFLNNDEEDLSIPNFKYIEKEIPIEQLATIFPFKSYFMNEEHSDLRLQSRTITFPAHKIILSNISPVFAANFRNSWIESQNHVLNLVDLSEETVGQLLYFSYTGELKSTLASNCLVELFVASCKYQIKGLMIKCIALAASCLSEDLVEDLMEAACLHNCNEMISIISDYVEEKHLDCFYPIDCEDVGILEKSDI